MKFLLNFLLIMILFVASSPVRGETDSEETTPTAGSAIPEQKTANQNTPQDKSFDAGDEGYNSVTLFMAVVELVRKSYVEKDKVKYEKLISGALKGMLQELDPFCTYETPEAHRLTTRTFSDRLTGVGLIIMKAQDGNLKVVAPAGENSPGIKAGVMPGDFITMIDGKKTTTIGLEECVSMLQGKAGTKTNLTIFRKSTGKIIDIEVVRNEVRTSPVPYNGVKMINNNIGYLRLSLFSAETGTAIDHALDTLEKQKAKGLIIDLRYNPGGLLGAAVDVCSRFIKDGELVIYTEGREKKNRNDMFAIKCRKNYEIPLVILVNNYSASGSEIVAGCLKDHKRALLVGSKTYGKGSVQRIHPLPNGGAVRFTIAHYYTPSAKLIDGKGIEPDIDVPLSYNDTLLIAQQLATYPGEIKPDKPGTIVDVELQRAVQILESAIKFNKLKSP